MEAFLGRKSGSLVDLLRQYGSGVKQRLGLLADDPAEFARGALLDIVPNYQEAQAAQNRLMGGEVDPQAYRNYIGKMQDLGGLLASIRVYHGSPHKFSKFDMSKIGTGEGAQAYGRGAYLAESPDVGQSYATQLSKQIPDRLRVDGNAVRGDSIYSRALEDVALIGKDGALQKLDDNIRFNEKYAPDIAEMYKSTRAQIQAVDPALVDLNRGYLYEANLRWPDAAREAADPMGPQHFLDWDAPLSEQRNILDALYNANSPATRGGYVTGSMGERRFVNPAQANKTGSGFLEDLKLLLGNGGKAEAELRRAGIPGIRYLDAGSRGAGEGTNNYVVFDDALIDLLTRNGAPVKK